MKKSKVKFVIRQAMSEYYEKGLTNTAANVRKRLNKAIDQLYSTK